MKRLPVCLFGGLGCVLAMALGAAVAAPPAAAQEVPYTGVVIEDETIIRAGAGRAYYSVGTLRRGDLVEVEELFHGWIKIKPPAGVFSYISKAYVNAQGDGKVGVVNRDRTEVKAANVRGPGTLSYRIIKELNEGDRVAIVAEENGWYKIEPLDGTFVFLEPGSVRRAAAVGGATEPVAPVAPVEPPAEPVTPQVPVEPVEPVAPVEPVEPTEPIEPAEPIQPIEPVEPAEPMEQPIELPEAGEPLDITQDAKGPDAVPAETTLTGGLAEVDRQMLPYFEKPLEEQPIDKMIAAYQPFLTDDSISPTDRRIVRLRLAALEHNKRVLAAIQRTDQTITDIQAARQEQERVDASTFDAVGILRASSMYDGTNMPLLYRLVDPTTQRARAYISPTPALNANAALGKLVGVRGPSTFDSAAKLTVIEPTRVTILEAEPQPQ